MKENSGDKEGNRILVERTAEQIHMNIRILPQKKIKGRGFPGGLVIKTSHFQYRGMGLIPGW